MSAETLQYPAKIAEEIGLSPHRINNFKKHGCRFFGRKTCVTWVREHLAKISEPAQPEHLQHSGESKSDARG